jgi:hypothetical protein
VRILENGKGSTRSPYVGNSLWKRLWNNKTDHVMMMMMMI